MRSVPAVIRDKFYFFCKFFILVRETFRMHGFSFCEFFSKIFGNRRGFREWRFFRNR